MAEHRNSKLGSAFPDKTDCDVSTLEVLSNQPVIPERKEVNEVMNSKKQINQYDICYDQFDYFSISNCTNLLESF